LCSRKAMQIPRLASLHVLSNISFDMCQHCTSEKPGVGRMISEA